MMASDAEPAAPSAPSAGPSGIVTPAGMSLLLLLRGRHRARRHRRQLLQEHAEAVEALLQLAARALEVPVCRPELRLVVQERGPRGVQLLLLQKQALAPLGAVPEVREEHRLEPRQPWRCLS